MLPVIPLDPPVLINSRLQQIEGKKLLGCLTCSAATDVGMLGNSKMPLNCLCTLLTSVVAAIVPSCLCAL